MKNAPVHFQKILSSFELLGNALASKSYGASHFLPDINKKVILTFDLGNQVSISDCSIFIYLKVSGIPCILTMDQLPLKVDIEEYVAEDNIDKLPDNLALATILTVLDPLIKKIEKGVGSELNIVKYSRALKEDVQNKVRIPFTFKIDDESLGSALLLFDEKYIVNFVSIIDQMAPEKNPQIQNLMIPVYVEYGRSKLPISLFKSIEVGDTLIIEKASLSNENDTCIRFSNGKKFTANKTTNKHAYNITKEAFMQENKLEQSKNLNELPITVMFDIAETTIALGELEKVGVGYTLRIDSSLEKLVTIRIENQIFAQGEIVEIGDSLGVRVTELSKNKMSSI